MRWIAALTLLAASCAQAQDADWLRMWEAAQRQRPRTISSTARIAPAKEPGTPLVIHGRVFQHDGKTPARDVIVFAYQTDNRGEYGDGLWRLHGWVRSDAEGRFTFETIRPASYPSSRNPAHVHLTIEGPNLPRRWTSELQFLDDPFVSAAQKRESEAAGVFGGVRPVTTRGGTQHMDFNIRISDEGRF